MPMFEQPNKNVKKGTETIVGVDVLITGNLKSDAGIEINGRVKGEVDTKNDILVGEQAVIEGSIKARNVVINGLVQGNLHISEDLEISPTGKVYGDLVTKNLIVKKGANFTGKSMMGEDKKKDSKPVYEIEETTGEVKSK